MEAAKCYPQEHQDTALSVDISIHYLFHNSQRLLLSSFMKSDTPPRLHYTEPYAKYHVGGKLSSAS